MLNTTTLLIFVSLLFLSTTNRTQAAAADDKFAKYLGEIRLQLDKNRLKSSTVNNALLHANKSKIFKQYKGVLSHLRPLAAAKNAPSNVVITRCNKLQTILIRKNDPVFNHILKSSNIYCVKRYLKNRVRASKKIKKFSGAEKKFLAKNFRLLLDKKLKGKFIRFLKKIDPNSSSHRFISEMVTSLYIDLNKTPDPNVITHLLMDEYITTYIQIKGLDDRRTFRFFKREFTAIRRAAERIIKGGGHDETKQALDNLVAFYSSNKKYIGEQRALDHFNMIIKRLVVAKRYSLAASMAKVSFELAPPELKEEAAFMQIWVFLRKGSPHLAVKVVEKNHLVENFASINSKLRYWSALAIKRLGNHEKAEELFYRQIEIAPVNYYSILSFKEIQKDSRNINARQLFSKQDHGVKKYPLSANDYLSLVARLNVWTKTNNDFFVGLEIDDVLKKTGGVSEGNSRAPASETYIEEGDNIAFKLVEYLNKNNNFLGSFKVMYSSIEGDYIDVNEDTLRILFPFRYLDTIKKIDKKVDPLLVLALIRQESAFDPAARSVVGARGLMQLMPATARRVRSGVRKHHLKRPRLNIAIGTKYFRKLLKKYKGNLIYALSAYNAGERNVRVWKKARWSGKTPVDMIEEIPFKETRKYVKLIYRNMFFYNMLSGQDAFLKQKFTKTFYNKKY